MILHPFHERVPPSALIENSKAALMLSGLIPGDGSDPGVLQRRLLAGRYTEVRMLFYVGKDLFRWIDQCVEWAATVAELADWGIGRRSLAALLTTSPPQKVRDKLQTWGVADYVSIFSRAIGLQVVFTEPPEFASLGEEFLRNYHDYVDATFRTYLKADAYCTLSQDNFQFSLFASGEYSKKLEAEWNSESR